MKLTILIAVAAAAGAAACTPLVVPGTVPVPHAATRSAAAKSASAQLARAVLADDPTTIILSFAPNAMVLTLGGDTLRASEAVRYVVRLAGDSAHPLGFVPGRSLDCLNGGVYEFGGQMSGPVDRATQRALGQYAILWNTDGPRAVVQEMTLTFDSRSLRGAAPCDLAWAHTVGLHRFTATLGVGSDPTKQSTSVTAAGTGIVLSQFDGRIPFTALNGAGAAPFPRLSTDGRALLAVGLRYLVNPKWSLELQGAQLPSNTAIGFDNRCIARVNSLPCDVLFPEDNAAFSLHNYLQLSNHPWSVNAVVQRQWGNFRFGIGPSVLHNGWTSVEYRRQLGFSSISGNSAEYEESGWTGDAGIARDEDDESSSGYAIGGTAELTAFIPITGTVTGALFVRGARYLSTQIPGTRDFTTIRVTTQSFQFGLSVGAGWR